MFDTHVDTLYVWVAVGAVSVAVLGVVTQLPRAAPPDAGATAETIDEVATGPPGAVASRDLEAASWSVTSRRIGLRSAGGTAHATLFRQVVPARTDALTAVLDGEAPSAVFDSPAAFEAATGRAATNTTRWRPAPETMTVRHVAWEGVDVTLVG